VVVYIGEFTKLIDVCNKYKRGDFGMQELQAWLRTVCLPDECYHTLDRFLNDAVEEIERIIYCYGESEKWRAIVVVDDLIQTTHLAMKQMEVARKY
jgi:hypothetical protein